MKIHVKDYTRPRSLTKVHFKNPRRCEILIADVAYHLARDGRYNNSIAPHYSVAEHSVLMAHYFLLQYNELDEKERNELARQALMHDAGEYLFGDVPAPIKVMLPDYKIWEDMFDRFVWTHFGLPEILDPRVKELDMMMCSTEQKVLRGHDPDTYLETPTLEEIVGFQLWDWKQAESEFLLMFHRLFPDYKDIEDDRAGN